jgi:hypothetical protein
MKSISFILFLFVNISCAGPTSPFGSSVLITSDYDLSNTTSLKNNNRIEINSYPKNLLYHTNFNLKLKIKNKLGFDKNFKYSLVYNGKKLNRWWESESIEMNSKRTEASINFQNISLLPGLKNDIVFLYYPRNNEKPLSYKFKGPECDLTKHEIVKSISKFKVNEKTINYINHISKKYNINPSLLTSLVAQESSFNSNAVSTSRAIGLTQVTPIADKDIRVKKTNWPTYPDSEKISYLNLKYKVFRGDINKLNDWRLDKYKSLEGGALFLRKLSDYWNKKKNIKLLESKFKDIPKTDIILASYNSGASRVKRNIKKYNKDWIWSDELGEARKYVMNIKSYCHTFKQ